MTEREQILTSVLNCRRIDLYVDPKPLTAAQERKISSILKRREAGEPLQYLLGFTEFSGLKFFVSRDALVPRPETDLLVDILLGKIKTLNKKSLQILDIGTGSGNIAVTLAKNLSQAKVTATDISARALRLAKRNALFHKVAKRIQFVKSDVFAALNSRRKFDIIVSNPPYVSKKDLNDLPPEVKREPNLALYGGTDGLDFYRRIIKEAPRFLKPGGLLFFEIGDGQRSNIEKIFKGLKMFTLDCYKDYRGIERTLIAELRHG